MELVSHNLEAREGSVITLAPLGDIQWTGITEHLTLSRLRRHISQARARRAYYVGLGDYTDVMAPSNRRRYKSAGLYDSAAQALEEKLALLIDEVYDKVLAPTRGRWLGMVKGHHYFEFSDGSTSDTRLARKLRSPYLGTSGIVCLAVRDPHTGRTGQVKVMLHHGNGGGSKAGAALNKIENFYIDWDVDVVVMGHTTKVGAAPVNRIVPIFNGARSDLWHRKVMLVNSGGWFRCYLNGARQAGLPQGGYVEENMLRPASLGAPLIYIKPLWKRKAGLQVFSPEITVEL